MRIFKLSFLLVLFSQGLMADDVSFDTIMDSMEDSVPEQTTEGQIRSIDLVNRTGVIGGYIYYFGPSTDAYPLQVKMLGKDFGSLEMLKVDMHVEVVYIQVGQHRVGNLLTQIVESEET